MSSGNWTKPDFSLRWLSAFEHSAVRANDSKVVLVFDLPVSDWLTRDSLWPHFWGREWRRNSHTIVISKRVHSLHTLYFTNQQNMFMHPMEIMGMHYALLQSKIHGVLICVPARVLVMGQICVFHRREHVHMYLLPCVSAKLCIHVLGACVLQYS